MKIFKSNPNLAPLIFIGFVLAACATGTVIMGNSFRAKTDLVVGSASDPSGSRLFQVTSTSKTSNPCPNMTEAQRNAVVSPLAGDCVYNTDAGSLNVYSNGAWGAVGGAGGGGISNAEYNFLIAAEITNRFETDVLGWTGSTTAPTLETTDEIEGEGSLSWDPAGAETLRSDAVTIPKAFYGTNCYAEISYTGGDVDYSMTVLDGSNAEIASSCGVTTSTNAFLALSGESAIAYCTFVCPSSGSAKINITVASNEPEIIIDRAYLGSNFRLSEVNQAQVAGESYFNTTTNCTWVVTSTTAAAFATDTDCPGPTVVSSSLGTWSTADTNLPQQTITNLPAGTYKATFVFLALSSAGTGARYHVSDGTTTSVGSAGYNVAASSTQVRVDGIFAYTSAGDRTFSIYGSSVSGSVSVVGTVNPTNFYLEKFPSESELAYTPPAQGNLKQTVYYDGYTGLSGAFIKLTTERQNTGGALITVDNTSYTKMTVNSEAFCTLTCGGQRLAGGARVAARAYNSSATLLIDASDSGSTNSPMSAAFSYRAAEGDYFLCDSNGDTFVNSQATNMSLTCETIKQSSAPLLVNSVVSPYSGVVQTAVANLNCDAGSAITSQLGTWVSSIGNVSGGACAITLASGVFSSAPYCTVSPNAAFASVGLILSIAASSATALSVDCEDDASGACTSYDFNIQCTGAK